MGRLPDPLRAHLSGSAAKKGRKPALIGAQSPLIDREPPRDLPEGARRHWDRLIASAVPGLLRQPDAIAAMLLAELLDQWDAEGAAMPASKVGLAVNLMGALGFTPSSRRRLSGLIEAETIEGDENPFAGIG